MDPALLSEIFKWLLKKPGGSCKMRTLIKDFPLVVSANSLIAQIAVYPNIFLLLDKGNPMESTLRAYIPSVQVCSKYYRKGQCGDKNCSSLHLCHSRLYHNFCRGSCLNHCNITASSLSGFSNDQKQILLRNSCLTVCSGYNTSHGCSNMEQYGSCPFVHVCVEAVQGTCTAGKGCPWNHSLLGEAHHKELYASRHITIDERTEHSLMTKLLIMPVVHILLVFLVQSGKDGASGEELELFLGINRKEVGIFVQAITKQANVHEKKVILRMSKFQICPYYNMGTECLCSGKAFHICAMYIMNKCRKCSLSHDVCDEYNEGLFTNNNCSHLSIWRRRQALRNSALVMCEEYALNGKCSNKACCAMHLCARWITNSCTSSCNKVHTFKTLHNIEVISVHDLSPWNDTELKMKIATVSIHVAKNDLKVNLDDTGVPPTSTDAMSTKDRKRHKTQEEPCKNVEVIGEGAELAKSPECLKLPQKTKEAALSRGHPSLPGAIKNINPKMEQPLDFCLHQSKSDLELPSKRLDKLRDCAEGNMAEQKYEWNAADERKSEAIKEKHEQKMPLSEFIVDEVAQGNSTDVSQLANVVSEVNVDVIQFCEEDTPLEFNVEESHPREVNIPHELNAEESQVCEETIQELNSDESQPYEETVQFYEDTNQELNSDESQPYEETVQFHEDINQELNSELSNFNGDISQKTNVNESQPIEGIVMQELAACNIQPDFNSTIEFNAAKGELNDNTTQKPVTDQKPVCEHSNDIDVEHNVANSRLSKELSTESKELEEVKELASMEIEVNPLSENNETIEDQCEKEPVFIPATEEVDKVLPVAGEDTLSTTTQNTQLGDMCTAGIKSDASRNSERSVDSSDLQTSHKEIHGNIEQIAENMRLQLNVTKEFDFCWKWLADDGTWHPYGSQEDSIQQDLIEARYQEYLKQESAGIICFETHSYLYEINFLAMQQINLVTSRTRMISRKPDSCPDSLRLVSFMPGDLPYVIPPWSPMDTRYPLQAELVALSLSQQEFLDVTNHFFTTFGVSTSISVLRVYRIQNIHLWRRYNKMRDEMFEKLGSELNERNLFHGTPDFDTVQCICNQNFDSRISGRHGTKWGNGAYFASSSAFSHQYTKPTFPRGMHYMFLATVLVGRYAQGARGLKRPPPYGTKRHSVLYDSVVNNTNDPRTFVIFNNDQAYPMYLIEYHDNRSLILPPL